jgi:meso-butanediol dehydrogenase / (S,S)-butanediol dehydrogenase / diacetyl reductase
MNQFSSMTKRFEEKSVLITGASRGIGKGIAKRFAEEGAALILSANEEDVAGLVAFLASEDASSSRVRPSTSTAD